MNQCIHRSETFRLEGCDGCSGLVQIKVFQCAKHGECTVSKSLPGIHVCDGGVSSEVAKQIASAPVIAVEAELQSLVERIEPKTAASDRIMTGFLVERIETETSVALVRLDSGEVIQARNTSSRSGHPRKRCVVRLDEDGRFVLLQ